MNVLQDECRNLGVVVEVGFEDPFYVSRVDGEGIVEVHHGHGVGKEILEVIQQPVVHVVEMGRLLQEATQQGPALGSLVVSLLQPVQEYPPRRCQYRRRQ